MSDLRNVVIATFTPVKDDAGLSGKRIGAIYGNFQPYYCVVDYAELHDRDVPLVNPTGLPFSAPEMWVEWSHCIEGTVDKDSYKVLVTVYTDGREPTAKIVG